MNEYVADTVGTSDNVEPKKESIQPNRRERRFMKALIRRTSRSKQPSVNKQAFYKYIAR